MREALTVAANRAVDASLHRRDKAAFHRRLRDAGKCPFCPLGQSALGEAVDAAKRAVRTRPPETA